MIIVKLEYHKNLPLLFSLICFIYHLIFIYLTPVNNEFAFVNASKFVENYDFEYLKVFHLHQANTIFLSLIVGYLNKLFFFFDYLKLGKLLSASSIILLYLSINKLFEILKTNKDIRLYLLILVITNPLIWTFSFRYTPDVFSTSLSFCSSIFLINNKKLNLKFIFFVTLFSIGVLIKPINLIYIVNIIFISFYKNNYKLNLKITFEYFILILFSILPLLLYIYFNYVNFGFYLFPKHFASVLNFQLEDFFFNFLLYLGYLGMITFPFVFFDKFIKKKFNLTLLVFLFICFVFLFSNKLLPTELNIGFLTKKLGYENIKIILLLFSSLMILFILSNFKKFTGLNKIFLLTSFIYLIIISLSLPSQRYLIVLVPLLGLFLINKKYQIILIICFNIIFSTLIQLNHIITANSSNKILYYLKDQNMLNKTCPGPLESHLKNHFEYDLTLICPNDREFLIVSEIIPNNIKEFHFNLLFFNKKYSIIKN